MHPFTSMRNTIASAALLTGLLVMSSTYGDTIVQYTVAGGTGDNWTGEFVVTNLDGLVTNNGIGPDAGTTVSVSGSPLGTFSFGFLTGNAPDQTSWMGQYVNPFDSLFTVRSADLYSTINLEPVRTWNALIAHGPYLLSSSGITRFGLGETGPDTFTQSYTVTGGTITFAAVPEPSTYAMALAGLACGGYSMWRWRKQA